MSFWREKTNMSIPKSVTDAISQYNMISEGDIIVVGVSGGADSVGLLNILYSIQKKYRLTLHAVHINHCLRGEDADNDQKFVENFCHERGIECHSFAINVSDYAKDKGLSFEEAGRYIRYDAFERIANLYNANKIATAHHMNDNCETVIHNILRGSGTTGLAGIHPVRGKYIRPLIKTSRDAIENYLQSEGISWCTDKTNFDAVYTRNKIRIELIPYLKENFNNSIESAITRMSALCGDDDDYMRMETVSAFNKICIEKSDKILIDRSKFNILHIAIKRRIIRYVLELLNVPLKDVHMVHINNCINFIKLSESGAFVRISNCVVSLKQSGIHFSVSNNSVADYSYVLEPNNSVFIAETGNIISCSQAQRYYPCGKNVIFINADKILSQLEVRNRRSGDKITPFGMKGTKKLKDFFIDNKIDIDKRNKIPLIVYNNEVIWICGYAMNDNYKISSTTNKILRIEIK